MKKREVFIFRNGNPLQYSCLESPVDRGGWWAAINGVAQSRTRLKRLAIFTMGKTIKSLANGKIRPFVCSLFKTAAAGSPAYEMLE